MYSTTERIAEALNTIVFQTECLEDIATGNYSDKLEENQELVGECLLSIRGLVLVIREQIEKFNKEKEEKR